MEKIIFRSLRRGVVFGTHGPHFSKAQLLSELGGDYDYNAFFRVWIDV